MAKRKSTLTKDTVAKLTYDPSRSSRQVLWDGTQPGFGCRVTPLGAKSYVLLYRFNGRPKLYTLGRIERLDLVDARQKAKKLLFDLDDNNVDPARARESMSATATITDIWEREYTEGKLNLLSANSQRTIGSIWTVHVKPHLGTLKPQHVTTADVLRMHDESTRGVLLSAQTGKKIKSERNRARGGKVVANRAVERLGEFLNWVKARNKDSFPPGWENPVEEVPLHKERPRKHYLDAPQLRDLMQSLRHESNPWRQAFLLICIFTGARKSEVRYLRWANLDLTQGMARIGKTKNGDPMVLHLPSFMIATLKDLPVVANCEWVFPGRSNDKPMIEPRGSYRAALERAKLPLNTTFHDLRRSFGTNLAREGASEKAIAAALNNTTEVAARVYIQLAATTVRDLSAKHAASLLSAPGASNGAS